MDGLAHIFLHVGLCSAVARTSPDTQVAMHVRMMFRVGDPPFDQTYRIPRGEGLEKVVEFDVGRGAYRLQIDVPKFNCASTSYVYVIADQNRKISATLADAATPPVLPILLMQGTAPTSFLYLKPTYVLFDSSATCDHPIPPPLPAHIDIAYEPGAYYASLYGDPSLATSAPVFAMRLRTVTGLAHYVRIRIPYPPVIGGGWPGALRLDVTDDMATDFATDKTDTLLCPKFWMTSSG